MPGPGPDAPTPPRGSGTGPAAAPPPGRPYALQRCPAAKGERSKVTEVSVVQRSSYTYVVLS